MTREPLEPGFSEEPFPKIVLQRTYKGVSKNLQNMVLDGTIFGSTKNRSNQGSLKNHFLKKFHKEPIKVSQRTF